MFARIALASAALIGCLSLQASAQKLGVGDPAPPLKIAQWVKGEPVTSFEKGKTYVVEFWATWCGPCKRSIPHVSELQKQFADKGVTMIGVSVWEREAGVVEPFVEKMGEKMAYRVGKDDGTPEKKGQDGTMARTWMTAAGQSGIPAAFVVDGSGTIAWIGHPMNMDAPLAQIVAGKWDVALEKKKQAREGALETALKSKDAKAALPLIDEILAADPAREEELGALKFSLLLSDKRYDEGYAYGAKLIDGALKDSPQMLNMIAWTIVDPDEAGLERRDLPLASRRARTS
jgi:thiol-disulfide isomerase/thioredoxin